MEDDRKLAASLRRSLIEARMAVDVSHDGEDGLESALGNPYDVIVLDVMLPRLDGLEFTRRLRDRRIQTPILMLTGRDAVDDRVAGLEAGADDYLVKPFALEELVARVRALLRRLGADEAASVLTFDELELNTGTREVRRGDESLVLTRREDYRRSRPGIRQRPHALLCPGPRRAQH